MAVEPSARSGLTKIFFALSRPFVAKLLHWLARTDLVEIVSRGAFWRAAYLCGRAGYSRAHQAIVSPPKSIGCDQYATNCKKLRMWRIYCLSVTSRRASFHNVT